MPSSLVDDPTVFPSSVLVPAAGDPRTDTSVAMPFGQLANRTANTKARIDVVAPSTAPEYTPALPSGVTAGASNILTAVSIVALQAIPAGCRSPGMICSVLKFGIYQWVTDTIGAIDNFVVVPADGAGAWVLLAGGYALANQPNAWTQGDSTGRLRATGVRNATFFETVVPIGSASVTVSTTQYTDIPGTTGISIPNVLVGDILQLSFIGSATTTTGWIFSVAPATTVPGISGPVLCGAGWSSGPFPADVYDRTAVVFGSYVATAAGTYAPRIQASLNNSGILVFIDCEMRIRVVRP